METGTKIVIGLGALLGLGVAYYFFVVKPEQEATNVNNNIGDNGNGNGNANGNGNGNGTSEPNPPPPVEPERFCTAKNYRPPLSSIWQCFPVQSRNGKSFILESVNVTSATPCCYVEGSGNGGGNGGGGNGGDGGNGDNGDGSFLCRSNCALLHPFNKDKREACKEKC